MGTVTLHYWAGAKAAAGTEYETVDATTIDEALRAVIARRTDTRLAAVIGASSLVMNGLVLHDHDQHRVLDGPVTVEILPPFAGG